LSDNTCLCTESWKGDDCSIPECSELDFCNNNGECLEKHEIKTIHTFREEEGHIDEPYVETTQYCQCNNIYFGEKCEHVCLNGLSLKIIIKGKLKNVTDNIKCICNSYWGGEACSYPACFNGQACWHGLCEHVTNVCDCVPGWYGDSCQTAKCERYKGCSKHSKCEIRENSHKCVCEPGFRGRKCNVNMCSDEYNPCVKDIIVQI
ncbi:hypothetical protein HZS_7970, partial [Henneguya salminicola]